MNILYTLNAGFEAQLLVSLNSLIEHTSSKLNVFIIYDGITEEKYKFIKSFENARVTIDFLKSPKIAKELVPDRGAKSQFYRLYILEIFKGYPKIEKILYLDCDTLVLSNNIEDLFNVNMKGYALAAAMDPWSVHYKKLFNLTKNDNMLNSGILLIDILCWKKEHLDIKIEKIINNKKYIVQGDQGLLNELVKGKFKIIEPRFNAITSYFEMNYEELLRYRKPVNFYSKKVIEDAVSRPVIVHFTSTFLENRPWQKGSKHLFKKQWIDYCDKYEIQWKSKTTNKKLKIVFNALPKGIAIYIFGILQAYIRPFFLKMKLH